MILLDSNIVIYLRDPKTAYKIVDQLDNQLLATCNIIVAEVLGFKNIMPEDATYFQRFIRTLKNYPFDTAVWTHNMADYRDINGLQTFDPLS